MFNVLVIGIGGFLGAIFRFLVSGFMQGFSTHPLFPLGTLSVNFLGSLLLASLSALSELGGLFTPETRSFLFIGLLGAFTTFSTFTFETFNLLQNSKYMLAGLNALLNISTCLAAVFLGRALVLALWR